MNGFKKNSSNHTGTGKVFPSGVSVKRAAAAVLLFGCAFLATGCGRTVTHDYESMRSAGSVAQEVINPMVTSQALSIRQKSFASSLCLPADTGNAKGLKGNLELAGLFDLKTKKTLYGSGLTQRVYPASTTKLMTALVALKHGDPSQRIKISEKAANPGDDAQRLVLDPGDSMTLEQAVNYLLVFSANDIAIAIAENVGGSYDAFVDLMNEEAKALGATGTHFTNPHGLHNENHYTTPYDLYLILNAARKNKIIKEILPKSSYNTVFIAEDGSDKSISVNATDWYLTGDAAAPEGITVIGGKTGTTDPAGHCLVLYSQTGSGNGYISVVMKTDTQEELYDSMNSLLSEIPN